ncbi:MAG: YceI family protein [Acidobacteriota bacterium]
MRLLTPSIFFGLLLAAAPSFAQTITWTIDPGHSTAQFTVRHMVVANVHGEFAGPTGTVEFDPMNITGTLRVHAVIDARSIDTRNPNRDADLRSANFFDVAKYPTLTFTSTRAEAAGAGAFKLTGDLTMHGVTRPVVLDVSGPTPQVKDLNGMARVGATATTTIDRRDYGLRYNELLEAGGAVVGNEIKITIDLEVTHR